MKLNDIAKYRLASQKLITSEFTSINKIVHWMGALQAQDYSMAKWAIGLRLKNATQKKVEQAIDNGEIIRTHILRPTWHFVAPEDIYWMLKLTAPHIRTAMASMNRKLELDDKIFKRSNKIIEKKLRGGVQLTRNELMASLIKNGIATNDIRSAHLMLQAELDGIVCNGSKRDKQFTYALLNERVPEKKLLTREESLATLAERYFISHGPATLKDFTWWSGLPGTDTKAGLEAIKSKLTFENIENESYWFSESVDYKTSSKKNIHLLPSFDEFMISYKNRSASIEAGIAKESASANGIFKPVIVINGKVAGIWRRTFTGDKVRIDTFLFKKINVVEKKSLLNAIMKYANFEGMKIK